MLSHTSSKAQSNDNSSKSCKNNKRKLSSEFDDTCRQARTICKMLAKKQGIHSANTLLAAGFQYTDDHGDTAKCNDCGLEVSNWTSDMLPFPTHSEQKPNCPFVRSMRTSLSTIAVRNTSASNKQNNPAKRQKTEAINSPCLSNTLVENNIFQEVRKRTFSHWPQQTIPSSARMIKAGFFNCNVGDRVICIYCNLICQEWIPFTDDPCEVHRTLSPNCIYVKTKLILPTVSSIGTVNESVIEAAANSHLPTTNNLAPSRSAENEHTAACHTAYAEISQRHTSFATWPVKNLPSVDDLVRAGFFYSGTKTIVTCFYCNGSLQDCDSNNNPTAEHARWFPQCAYAKQLCGDELYRKIQEAKQAQQERANEVNEQAGRGATLNTNLSQNSRKLHIPDESTLSRLVAARLDLPSSQRLLDRHFKLSIIKRCWEDQLRLKLDDFVSECDLFIACTILQKQIEHIDGKKENIVIPSIKMKQSQEQISTVSDTTQLTTNIEDVEMIACSQSSTKEFVTSQSKNGAATSSLCVLCLAEEKRLACIPCGHLATCVACGHLLHSCPVCRSEIQAFVRIYS